MPEEEPLLLPTDKGPTLRWRGLDFYPRTDPVDYARRKARVFSPLRRSLYFVPSVGLGYGLADLLAALPLDCSVLCVEAFQEIMKLAAAHGSIPRDPRLVVVRTQDPEAAAAALRNIGTGRFRRVVEAPLNAGYRLSPELYGRIRRRLEQEVMRFWQNRLTMIAMGSLQVRNVLANIPLLRNSLDFSALSTLLPVVVAGAGPSLEASLPVLARARERLTLVAVDTALASLAAAGIFADVVVALEAQAVNNQDFIGGVSRPGTFLACDLSVHPAAARLFEGRLCWFCSEFAPLSLWRRLAMSGLRPFAFPALGSVGVAAAHAALRITDNGVYLTGMDLSFPGSKTHANGSPFVLAMLAASGRFEPVGQSSYRALAGRRLMRVADKHGRPVLADRVLLSYRDSLEEELGDSAGRVLDCGETGLPLGVRAISTERFQELLLGTPVQSPRLRVDQERRFEGDRIADFVAAERSLLLDVAEAAAAGGTGGRESGLGGMLAEADYAWAHFPDVPDLSAPDRGFLARARVAALYYAERLRRIESVL